MINTYPAPERRARNQLLAQKLATGSQPEEIVPNPQAEHGQRRDDQYPTVGLQQKIRSEENRKNQADRNHRSRQGDSAQSRNRNLVSVMRIPGHATQPARV